MPAAEIEAQSITHEMSSNSKNVRVAEKNNWTNHGFKHFPSKNLQWKDIVASTKNGAAKYHPSIEIEKLERLAWEKGIVCKNGKVMKFDYIVGATNGIETNFVRIKYSANTIHGHPITAAEYAKLIS